MIKENFSFAPTRFADLNNKTIPVIFRMEIRIKKILADIAVSGLIKFKTAACTIKVPGGIFVVNAR